MPELAFLPHCLRGRDLPATADDDGDLVVVVGQSAAPSRAKVDIAIQLSIHKLVVFIEVVTL